MKHFGLIAMRSPVRFSFCACYACCPALCQLGILKLSVGVSVTGCLCVYKRLIKLPSFPGCNSETGGMDTREAVIVIKGCKTVDDVHTLEQCSNFISVLVG